MVMLGQELVLSGQVVRDRRFDYVALGHIHRHQELNGGTHPPVVYPGSIERVDFGEANERKGFVLAEVSKGESKWEFYPLRTRPYLDIDIEPQSAATFMADVMSRLPLPATVRGAVCRVRLTYPHDWEASLDEAAILQHLDQALSVHIQKHRSVDKQSRLGDTANVESLSREELLLVYWRSKDLPEEEITVLEALAKELFAGQEL
jgi:exonuclease SbcD